MIKGKYKVTIGNDVFEPECGDNNIIAISGQEFKCEYQFKGKNILSLRLNGKNYNISLSEEGISEDKTVFSLESNSNVYEVICKNETDLLIDKFSTGKKDNRSKNAVKSPMPGIVLKLNVGEKDTVKKGDVLLVLEAMKMENELKSPMDGVIKKISVQQGSSVEKNQMLIEIE